MTEAEKEEYLVNKRRQEGIPCTLENFLAWRERFDKEMTLQKQKEATEREEQEAKTNKNKKKEEVKFTGYQIFMNKIGILEENAVGGDGEGEEELAAKLKSLDVDEELFDD